MNKVECPCCGAKLKITVEPFSALSDLGPASRPAKSQYATVRDTPTRDKLNIAVKAPLPEVPKKKYRVDTDIGAFRQALADAGFADQAENGSFFNDKGVERRRLKLWFGRAVCEAPEQQRQQLTTALLKYFGDRLIMNGSYANEWDRRCNRLSYIVRLKL